MLEWEMCKIPRKGESGGRLFPVIGRSTTVNLKFTRRYISTAIRGLQKKSTGMKLRYQRKCILSTYYTYAHTIAT